MYKYLVDKKTGATELLEKIKDKHDKSQILLVDGIDTEFIIEFGVKSEGQNWAYAGKFLITGYFNYEEEPKMSLTVGNYTIHSITRKLPKVEFEFERTDNRNGQPLKKVFDYFTAGLKSLAIEE